MNFIVRSARREDLKQLMELARQFTLLNLPADKNVIGKKIDKSIASFEGKVSANEAEYLFVLEDTSDGFIAGSSQIVGKKGNEKKPAYSFQILKKERFSKDLGIGFIHQVLRLRIETDGAAEVGGLVLDRGYRRLPEKLGKLMSLIRFLYIALDRQRFGKMIHSEMAPPLTEEGRSEFWEALGRRFTGMPYAEADALSQQNKGFIEDLFPEEDIYLALLDSRARLVMGRVAEETQAAEYMLKKIGFEATDEVDPFDGGPHLKAEIDNIPLIKNGRKFCVNKGEAPHYNRVGYLAIMEDGEFFGCQSAYMQDDSGVYLPEKTKKILKLKEKSEIFLSPME
ncbi:MAG: arginine N-succinyltransferase [Bdellovibrionales bacterium]|nr:arginine N-succinyltransferase [Bdellovibrionales bacterium]